MRAFHAGIWPISRVEFRARTMTLAHASILLALGITAAATALAQRRALLSRDRLWELPAWVLAASLVAAAMLTLVAGHASLASTFGATPANDESAVGFGVTLGALWVLLASAIALVVLVGDRWTNLSFGEARRGASRAMVAIVPPLILAAIAIAFASLFRETLASIVLHLAGAPGRTMLVAAAGVCVTNAGALAAVSTLRGRTAFWSVLIALAPSALACGLSLLLYRIGIDMLGVSEEQTHHLRTLGASGDTTTWSLSNWFLRWLALYAGTLFAIAVPAAVALRVAPEPVRISQRQRVRVPRVVPPVITPQAAAESGESTPEFRQTIAPPASGVTPVAAVVDVAPPPTTDTSAFPRRWQFALFALAYIAALLYASIVPLTPKSMTLEQGVQEFQSLEWLRIDLDRRADEVVKMLACVPLSFAAMAALAADRRRWLGWVAALPIGALCNAAVLGVIFVQLWFPPRTATMNRVLAYSAGVWLGVVLWLAVGPWLVQAMRVLARDAGTWRSLRTATRVFVLAIIVHALVPMDFIYSLESLRAKYTAGRISFIADLLDSNTYRHHLLRLARTLATFAPVGVMFRLGWERPGYRARVRSFAVAAAMGLAVAIALETARLFVFTALTDAPNIAARAAGACVGAWLAVAWMPLREPIANAWRWLTDRRVAIGASAMLAYFLFIAAMLWRPFTPHTDTRVIVERLGHLTDWPFVNYYYPGLQTAIGNLGQYASIALPLGVILRFTVGSRFACRFVGWVAMMCIAIIAGLAIEIGVGVVRSRSIPDSTDFMALVAGIIAGWVLAHVLLPQRARVRVPGDDTPKTAITTQS